MNILKRVILLISIFLLSSIIAFSQTLELKKGWNLKGTYLEISNLSQFNKDGISTIWVWKEKKWIVYSPIQSIKTILNNYKIPEINNIHPGDGFWINVLKDIILNISGEEINYNAANLEILKGWNLKSIPLKDKTVSINIFSISSIYSIWKWYNNKWNVWSPKKEIQSLLAKYKIPNIDKISSGTGFWIYTNSDLSLPFYQIPPTPEITDEKDFYPQSNTNFQEEVESANILVCVDENGNPINNDNCTKVCCKIGATYHKVPKYFCSITKGEIVSADICSEKVCCDTGSEVKMEIKSNCKKILPSTDCISTVCCEIGDKALFLSKGMCNKLKGNQVDAKYCDNEKVCCKKGNNFTITTELLCQKSGGVKQANSDLCVDVCCNINNDSFMKTPLGVCTIQWNGIKVDADKCQDVCCKLSNDLFEINSKGECEAKKGTPTDQKWCEDVCCKKSDNSFSMINKGTCLSKGWTIVDNDNCQEVCCQENDFYFINEKGNCKNSGMKIVEKDKCSDICCEIGDKLEDFTKGECLDKNGKVISKDKCDNVCCDLGDGTIKVLEKGNCEKQNGKITSDDKCEEVCCLENGKFFYKQQSQCKKVVDEKLCGGVCCKIGNDYSVLSGNDCNELKGTIASDDKCVKTCCFDGNSYNLLSAGVCEENNFKKVSSKFCEEKEKCCIFPGNTAYKMKIQEIDSECIKKGGIIGDNGLCKEVCCMDPEDNSFVNMLYYDCEINNMKVADDSLCEEICLYNKSDGTYFYKNKGTYLNEKNKSNFEQVELSKCEQNKDQNTICCSSMFGNEFTTKSWCINHFGIVVPNEVCVGEVCCVKNGEGSIIEKDKCEEKGGKVYPFDACEDVCCYTGNGYEIVKKFECGIPTLDESKCNMVCCKQGEKYYKTTDGDCKDAKGEILSSDKCDKVCCKIGIDYKETIKAVCEKQGKVSDSEDCEETCCIVGDTSFITSMGACNDFPGRWWVNDTKNCKKMVCCLENDKAFIETLPVCNNNMGTIFPIDTCNEICCDKTKTFMKELTCMKVYGGKKVDNKVCENSNPNICCKTGDEYSIVPEDQCFGEKLSLDSCATVCCGNLAGDFYYTKKQKCIEFGKQILPDANCQNEDNKVCCYVGGGYEYRKVSECSSKIYKPDEYCENNEDELVCCAMMTGEITVLKSECKNEFILHSGKCDLVCCFDEYGIYKTDKSICEGKILELSACNNVCCKKGNGFYTKTIYECKQIDKGEVVDKDYCEMVCCENNGIYHFTSKAECSGNIVDNMKCLEQSEESDQSGKVCCYGGGDYYYWIEKDKCSVTADNSKCENYGKVCCVDKIHSSEGVVIDSYHIENKDKCPTPASDPTMCDTICCKETLLSNNSQEVSFFKGLKGNCESNIEMIGGREIVDDSYCENQKFCCEYKKNTQYASVITYGEVSSQKECEEKNGQIVLGEYCDKVCCKTSDGKTFIATSGLCEYKNGTTVDFSECGDIDTSKQCTPYEAVWEMEGEWCPGEGGEPIESFLISVFYESTAFCDKNGKCYMSLDMLYPVGTTFDAFGCKMKIKDCKK